MTRRYRILVCRGPECGDRRSSAAIHAAMEIHIRARGLEGRCELGWQSCFGRCRQGPNVLVRPIQPGENRYLLAVMPLGGRDAALYNGVEPLDVPRILEEHVMQGRIVVDKIHRP